MLFMLSSRLVVIDFPMVSFAFESSVEVQLQTATLNPAIRVANNMLFIIWILLFPFTYL